MAKNSLDLRDELFVEGHDARTAGLKKSDCPYLSEKYINSSSTYVKRNVKYWLSGWEVKDKELSKEKSS